jgi:hypothetical protein
MSSGDSILARAKSTIDTTGFREQSWTGTFAQYLDVVRREPRVTRTAFERIRHDLGAAFASTSTTARRSSASTT